MTLRLFGMVGRRSLWQVGLGLLLACFTAAPMPAFAQGGKGGPENNRLVSVAAAGQTGSATVTITTGSPVGYRYTAYEASDPARIVFDFPGMVVAGVAPQIHADVPLLKDIRTSSLDLPSGKLGRVEVLLARPANYKVSFKGNDFVVSFAEKTPAAKGGAQASAPAAETATPKAAAGSASPAKEVASVAVERNGVAINADGRIDKYRYFTLGAPPRLVVDVYGVRPGFDRRSFTIPGGFKDVRVGAYHNKTRFVFDGKGAALPPFSVQPAGDRLLVSWGKEAVGHPSEAAPPAGEPVTVKAVNFKVVRGTSLITVSLSGKGRILPVTRKDDTVRFGVKNAVIRRALRRTIDASAFPSAVRLVTPYTATVDGTQDVKFAVKLKGPVPYSLSQKDRQVVLAVDNGPFAERRPAQVETKQVPAPAPAQAAPAAKKAAKKPVSSIAATSHPANHAVTEARAKAPHYGGQKISLNFDNADIRKILQLIGDVSGLNIIAGQDVKGTITLHLENVPWDQALELILETQGLGKLQEGNVVRILPMEQIRKRRQAELTAKKEERDLEPLETQVIAVSYTDLSNVVGPVKDLLTSRGKITQDPRNKQVIVTDVPSVIQQVRRLVKILDTPEKQVMIEARIVEASSSFTRNLGVNWGFSFQPSGGGPWDPSSANIGLGGDFLITPPTAGTVGGAGLGSGITFGRVGIDSTVLDLRLSALESSGEGKIISSPRVSTVNGGEATISQGTKIPYQSSGNNGLPKTEFIDANLSLKVKPVINPDNSIILDIDATNSSLGADVPVGTGSAPSVDTKEAKTKLLVKDGETTVIGGIYVENDSNNEVGVPLLQHVPILGHLFKSTSNTKTRSELLVFITPRIVGE